MTFSDLLRRLAGRPRVLRIDLTASDRMVLAKEIRNLSDEECASLNWSQQERKKLSEALMVRNPKGYDGWHPTDEELFTVALVQSQWEMVERLCAERVSDKSDDWPERVLTKIRERTA